LPAGLTTTGWQFFLHYLFHCLNSCLWFTAGVSDREYTAGFKKLAEVDPELQKDGLAAHPDEYIIRLNRIEAQVSQTSVPLSFTN